MTLRPHARSLPNVQGPLAGGPSAECGRRLPVAGDVVLGGYRVVRELGRGGMGVVFEGAAPDGKRVAIKISRRAVDRDETLRARLVREARIGRTLESRFVTHVRDCGWTPGGHFVVLMDLLTGRSLRAEACERGPLPIGEAASYVVQACAAVAAAHRANIVHRDLKLSNLFLVDHGGERLVKVVDFGIAKLVGDAKKLTSPFDTLGTVSYMPPEQVRSPRSVDERADVWALGVVLFRLLTGALPIQASSYTEVAARLLDPEPMPRLDPGRFGALAEVVARALAKDVRERFPDAHALGLALEPFASRTRATEMALMELTQADASTSPDDVDPADETTLEPASEETTLDEPTLERTTARMPAFTRPTADVPPPTLRVRRVVSFVRLHSNAVASVGAVGFAAAAVATVLAGRPPSLSPITAREGVDSTRHLTSMSPLTNVTPAAADIDAPDTVREPTIDVTEHYEIDGYPSSSIPTAPRPAKPPVAAYDSSILAKRK